MENYYKTNYQYRKICVHYLNQSYGWMTRVTVHNLSCFYYFHRNKLFY